MCIPLFILYIESCQSQMYYGLPNEIPVNDKELGKQLSKEHFISQCDLKVNFLFVLSLRLKHCAMYTSDVCPYICLTPYYVHLIFVSIYVSHNTMYTSYIYMDAQDICVCVCVSHHTMYLFFTNANYKQHLNIENSVCFIPSFLSKPHVKFIKFNQIFQFICHTLIHKVYILVQQSQIYNC